MSAGATKKRGRNKKFRGWYTNVAGKRTFFMGCYDRTATLETARDLETQHRRMVLTGEVPKTAVKHRGRAFKEALSEYLDWGTSAGSRHGRGWAPAHCKGRTAILKWWQEHLHLERLGDLQENLLARAEEALRDLEAAGLAPKTRIHYATGLVGLCSWAAKRQYIDGNPVEGLCRGDKSPKTIRRALSGEEVRRLVAGCAPSRRLLYTVAAATGLRRGELMGLTVADLDTEKGGLRIRPEIEKARRGAFQPVASWVLAALVEAARGKGPGDKLMGMTGEEHRAFAGDLRRAGIEQQAFGGRATFHSLRHTFGCLVDRAGASAKECQTMMRHAPQGLTFGVYVEADPARLREIAEAVGQAILPKSVQAVVQLAATGTDDVIASPISNTAYAVEKMVPPTGLKPVASCSGGKRSIQLS